MTECKVVFLSPEQEGVHLHGLDGHGEALLHLEALVQQGQGHLLHARAVQLGEELFKADLECKMEIRMSCAKA